MARAATPIDTAQPFYLQSNVGTTVNPDFQGGTLRDNVNAVTDAHNYTVENFPTNTIDEFGNTVTFTGTFSGAGPLTFVDSVGGGNAIFTGASVLGGAVTINSGATVQWGNGTGGAFLLGAGNAVVDNGSLVMDFGGGSGIIGLVPISGTGSVTIESGTFTEQTASTYTGPTTIDVGAVLKLENGGGANVGSVAGNIVDNGLVQFEYGGAGPVIAPNTFTGTGAAEVVSGTVVITGASAIGGTVTIDPGATMQWGNGNAAFLLGASNSVVDNGALVMNFGGGGVAGTIAISGTGTVEVQSGALNAAGASTYTGTTTIDAAGFFALSAGGSISDSSNIIDNGIFDISGETTGTSITTLTGAGQVSVGSQVLTLTAASGTFSGVIQDAGFFPGTGGGLTIAGGTETLTGTNTFTGPTTINVGATLALGNGGTTGTVAGNVVDNGLVQFDYGGSVINPNTFTGTGAAEVVAGTAVISGASAIGGTVTIDPGATMQWGNSNPAFLIGIGGGLVDNGALVMNFGGGGVAGTVPISGTGTVEIQSGAFNEAGISTYTGTTTIDANGFFALSAGGSISNSSNVIDNGIFDISGEPAGTSITTLTGTGQVSVGSQTLKLTAASGTFSGVIQDAGFFPGTGGGLEIAGGTETLTGTNTFTGPTTIDIGATLVLGNGGTTGTVAGNVVDNGLVQFNYGGSVINPNTFTGTGAAEVVAGTAVITGASAIGGTVTIDPGATMQWGNSNPAFLIGGSGGVVDNGALTMNFGGGGVAGTIPISGTGTVEIQSGAINLAGASTYTGTTTIDAAGFFALSAGGSISDSSNIIDKGIFDISGETTGTSITTLTGTGQVSVGSQVLTLTAASGTFSGVIQDAGFFPGTGGGLTIAGGTETLTGTNTFTGPTTINVGATLALGNGGTTGTVAGNVVDNGLVQFNYGGSVVNPNTFTGTGAAEVVAGTAVFTGASAVGGNVTIDPGATMQWGNGNAAFLIGGTGVIDNGTLLMNFGGGGVGTSSVISGTGRFELETGSFNTAGVNTYTGTTTIDSGALLLVSGAGSIAGSSNVIDNGIFDITGTTAGTSITTLTGTGQVSVGAQTLTLSNASGTFSGVIQDAGLTAGTGGGLTIAGGTETLTGTNTFTGPTTINTGATLMLGNGGTTGTVAGNVVDNGLVRFNYGGTVVNPNTFSGSGSAEIVAGTAILSGASAIGGTVTIDHGATMQWGNGNPAFLIGGSGGVVDNGALVMDFGGGGVGGAIPISGTGSVTIQSGSFNDSSVSTYTGTTTIDTGTIFALSGSGSIASSGDPLVNGTFDISGTTTGTSIVSLSGSGTVDLGSKTLTLTNASDTFSGVISDGGIAGGTGGSLTLAAGNETLSGASTYTGPTTINGGTLNVTGSIASSSLVAVNTGGTLKGTGTISSATIAAGATLAPGNPLGTLTLTGNETFASGSIFDANINGAGQSGNVSAAGTTTINGGTVDVIEAAGHYNPVTHYVLIDSTGGVTGTFTNVTSSLANFAPTLIYGPDTVTLSLIQTNFQFGTVFGTTPNQISTGQAVTATGGSSALYIALANFASANPSATPAALDSLSGEIHASLLSAMIEDSRMIRDTVLDRLAHPEPEGIVVWATGFGDFGHIGSDGNAASVHRQESGAIVGLEGDLDPRVRAGIAGAFTSQTIDVSARASTASGTNGHLIAYASWNADPIWFSFGVDHGWGSNDVTRHVAFLSETDTDHQSNDTTQAFGEVRYEFAMDGGTIAPYGDLVWVEAQTDAFTETGGLDALSGGGKAQHDDYTTLGLRGALDEFPVYGVGVTPRAAAAWQHSLNGFAPTAAFTFAGSNQPFTIIGAPLANNAAALQVGVDLAITPALRLWVGYDGQISSNVESNAVNGQIAWTF